MPKKPPPTTRPDMPDDQGWIVWLSLQPENRGIEVAALYRRMLEWCMKKGVPATRRRLIVWLNMERENMPMTYVPPFFDPATGETTAPTADEPELPSCEKCKNERFISKVVDPEAEFEWQRRQMVPCPSCTPKT